jgi:hypothetical protein
MSVRGCTCSLQARTAGSGWDAPVSRKARLPRRLRAGGERAQRTCPRPSRPAPCTQVGTDAKNVNQLGLKLSQRSLYGAVTRLFGKAKRAMMRGDYVPATDPRMMNVFGKLDWLQRPPTLVGYPTPERVFTV